ncbi:hypothetical protein ABCJ02_005237 [Salmonella enterica]
MDEENVSSQKRFLKEAENEQRSREIRRGKAWLSVQRMLKRSGKTCTQRVTDDRANTGDTSFDIYTVHHLYLLQLAAGQIKSYPELSSWVEICEVQTRPSLLAPWLTSHIIVPRLIRRKAHAFLQALITNIDNLPSQRKALTHEFSGGLYAALCRVYKTKTYVDEIIASFPLTRQEMYFDPYLDAGVYLSAGLSKAPSFTLFLLECDRLGYKREYAVLRRLPEIITDNTQLNMLGDALFFTLLYQSNEKDLFSSFFNSLDKASRIKVTHDSPDSFSVPFVVKYKELRRNFIKSFIDDIGEKYLFDSEVRRKIRESHIQKEKN